MKKIITRFTAAIFPFFVLGTQVVVPSIAEGQSPYCQPPPSYAVHSDPDLWCTSSNQVRHTHLFITVPGEYQWSDRDGFGAYIQHDLPIIREQLKEWRRRGLYDYTDPKGFYIEKRPAPHESFLEFSPQYYNIFDSIDVLADKFCSKTTDRIAEIGGNLGIHILSSGFGAKVVMNAIRRGCVNRWRESTFFRHSIFYPELPNFGQLYLHSLPPSYSPNTNIADYAFGKFDVYKHYEANSTLNVQAEEVISNPHQFIAQSPYRAFHQEIVSPESNSSINARNYGFKYNHDSTLEPTNLDWRYEFSLFQAHLIDPYCFKVRRKPDGTCGDLGSADCQARPEECLSPNVLLTGVSSFEQFRRAFSDGPVRDAFDSFKPTYEKVGFGGADSRIERCGDGHKGPLEQCDPPNGMTCNKDCQLIRCGDSKIEGKEQCDPPVPDLCDDKCKNVVKCGNKRRDPGEQCDPPENSSAQCNNLKIEDPTFELTGKCRDNCSCEIRRRED